jgi:hypothetical protein
VLLALQVLLDFQVHLPLWDQLVLQAHKGLQVHLVLQGLQVQGQLVLLG